MAGITLAKLAQVQKAMEVALDGDTEALAAFGLGMDGLRAAVKKGEMVTSADLSDILGEIVITKAVEQAAQPVQVATDGPQDPMAPILLDLFNKTYGDQIAKGADLTKEQDLFNKAWEACVGQLDAAIGAAAEATAIELGKGEQVNFAKDWQDGDPKKAKTPGQDDDDDDDDEDSEDMEKILKSLGASPVLINKIGALSAKVEKLETERDLELFIKAATDIGEPASFGAELLRLHNIDPRLADSVKKRLSTKNAALKKGNMWSTELGAAEGTGSAGAAERITAAANEAIKKGEKDEKGRVLTFYKAFTQVCARDPELYREYQDEQARAKRSA